MATSWSLGGVTPFLSLPVCCYHGRSLTAQVQEGAQDVCTLGRKLGRAKACAQRLAPSSFTNGSREAKENFDSFIFYHHFFNYKSSIVNIFTSHYETRALQSSETRGHACLLYQRSGQTTTPSRKEGRRHKP